VINFAQPGLGRTPDGVLHVLYTVKNGTKADILQATVTPAGSVGGGPVVATGWSSASHPDLLVMPDGTLRAFWGGIRSTTTGETNNSLNTATAPRSGGPWTLQTGKAAQATWAYATSAAGAGLAKDGSPISTWSGTPGVGFHYGVDPARPDGAVPKAACCLYDPDIATDSASGQSYVGFYSNEKDDPGVFAQAISPSGVQGGRLLAPGSRAANKSSLPPSHRAAITGRIGAPGVFYVYGRGYPTYETLAVWRVGSSRPQLVLPASRMQDAHVATAPEGRLWLMWERNGTIYVTRTNKAVTRVGPQTALRSPGGGSVYGLWGEGSAGPLDLFANVLSGAQAFWHQQVWPKLTLTARSARTSGGRTLVFRVLDAGDPVAGAKIVGGGINATTDARGSVAVRQRTARPVTATASRPGYVSASLRVR
jgi:hypothetical protein